MSYILGGMLLQEDALLLELVASHGTGKWSSLARSIPGRSGKSCEFLALSKRYRLGRSTSSLTKCHSWSARPSTLSQSSGCWAEQRPFHSPGGRLYHGGGSQSARRRANTNSAACRQNAKYLASLTLQTVEHLQPLSATFCNNLRSTKTSESVRNAGDAACLLCRHMPSTATDGH